MSTKVAICHGYFTQRVRPEKVVRAMVRGFPESKIYTSLNNENEARPDFKSLDMRYSALNRIPERTRMLQYAPESVRLRIRGAEVPFDVRTLDEITNEIVGTAPDSWHVVITPNLHHIHLLRQDTSLLEVYQAAKLIIPDGWPVAWMLSRVSKSKVGRVTGSDLLERILAVHGGGRRLVLVGGADPDVLSSLAERAQRNQWDVMVEPAPKPEVENVDPRRDLVTRVAKKGEGGIVVLGLGAPKQELFAHELLTQNGSGHILCLGMAINFSSGRYRRSPNWMQRAKLEWIHRIMTEPRRLFPRYVRDARALVPTLAENSRRAA
ncbi:WecB/TagA/CpsF family glycosyltransferase [Rhodococcus sp. IEGM 1351]|uniref:WecB/TagA/CpsF family glycosyltransferase n=1 Tax=Rhodococcus sp. IEGM 1351 TaxID=3047089 RepID=UPI0024B86D7C|nr:WecB/TagA/CpsF family glycosyltransferase [Rhodococcus sp. IEGM 1351]MDI9940705.1 WecB/TagA/CpsF family glycosyltransferase [Rhodococcus sp. IEGM 1351]